MLWRKFWCGPSLVDSPRKGTSEAMNTVALQAPVAPISLRRRVTDHMMTGVAILTVFLVLAPLVAIFGYLVYRGVGAIDWAFLTQTPKPVGETGEIGRAS